MLELSLSGRAAGGVLTHTNGRVALVRLTHLALLAVVIQAGVFRNESTARCKCVARAGGKSALCGCLSREME